MKEIITMVSTIVTTIILLATLFVGKCSNRKSNLTVADLAEIELLIKELKE